MDDRQHPKFANDADLYDDEDDYSGLDGGKPIYRSLHMGQAGHDADFPDIAFQSAKPPSSTEASRTYDAEDEVVFRSLVPPPMAAPPPLMRGMGAAPMGSLEFDPMQGLNLGAGGFGAADAPKHVLQPVGSLHKPALARSGVGGAAAAPAASAAARGGGVGLSEAGANLRADDVLQADLLRARPVQLPLPPFALAHTHVFVRRPATGSLVKQVSDILSAAEIDFTFGAAKCKWKAVQYEAGAAVSFRVRLFENAEQAVILEMQRRQGDLLQFKRVFHSVRASMAAAGLAKDVAGRAPMMRVALPPSDAPPLSESEMVDAMEPLFGMLFGEYFDSQREAAFKLVSFSSSLPHMVAYERRLVEIVRLLENADNADVRRCAVSIVANVCEVRAECQARVVQARALSLLMPLAAGAGDVDCETQRESARLLATLCAGGFCDEVKEAAEACPAVQDLLRKCDAIGDVRLRSHVAKARTVLQQVEVA